MAKRSKATKVVINKRLATKLLKVVDAGLVCGLGKPQPGKMCVEAAVCYAMGLPHSDQPKCVHPDIRSFKIALNDSGEWGTNKQRAKGLRRIAVAQLGSRNTDTAVFARRVIDQFITRFVYDTCAKNLCNAQPIIHGCGLRVHTCVAKLHYIAAQQSITNGAVKVRQCQDLLTYALGACECLHKFASEPAAALANIVEVSVVLAKINDTHPAYFAYRLANIAADILIEGSMKTGGAPFVPKYVPMSPQMTKLVRP